MGCEENTAHGQMPDERASCNHVRVIENQNGERICKWCGVFEADFDFDPADHPDAGGPAGRNVPASTSEK